MCARLPLFTLFAVSLLSACGFSPVYGDRGAGSAAPMLNAIAIGNIPDRDGQMLRNRLIDRFYGNGRPSDPLWSLDIAPVRERLSEIDITKDSDATRGQLRLETDIRLRRIADGTDMLHRTVRTTTGYNIVASRFATRVTEDAARTNAVDDLARQIESAIALFAARQ